AEPSLPVSFSTTMTSSLATRYCLPPVLITANMGLSAVQKHMRPREARAGGGAGYKGNKVAASTGRAPRFAGFRPREGGQCRARVSLGHVRETLSPQVLCTKAPGFPKNGDGRQPPPCSATQGRAHI